MLTTLHLLLQAVLSGILLGGLYAAMGIGLALVWGVMKILNISHAALATLGAYLSLTLFVSGGLDPLVSLIITVPALFLIGVIWQTVVVKPMAHRKEYVTHTLLILYGFMVVIENLSVYIWTADVRLIATDYLTASLSAGPFSLPMGRLASFLLASLAVFGVFAFLKFSRVGWAVRAIATDREAAALMGIPVNRISQVAFGISTATAAIGGLALGLVASFSPGTQILWVSKAFLVVILGGVDNILGLFLSALLLGVAENVMGVFAPAYLVDFVAYILLILTLMLRPRGLLGGRI